MNGLPFLQEHWNVFVVVFLATAAMIAVSYWMLRHQHGRSYLTLGWGVFLLILGAGCWHTQREVQAFRNVWKDELFQITQAFASATESIGHWKIDRNTGPDDPVYQEIRNVHTAWCRNVPQVVDVYTLRSRPDEPGRLDWVMCRQPDGDPDAQTDERLYQPCDTWLDIYGQGFMGQPAIGERVEPKKLELPITVVAPLKNPQGTVEAILCVDFRVDRWEKMSQQKQLVAALLFAASISLYLLGVVCVAILQRSLRTISETNRELIEMKKFADLAARAKSDFLANMSHEIRTPMNAVLGFTDILVQRLILRGTSKEREEFTGIAEIIRKNSRDLLTIINDILDFSRMEANLLEVESVPVSIKQVIEDIHQMAQPNAEAKFLDLSVEYKEPIPELILSDPTRLRQILMNLVNNAVKFTEKGRIRILCSTISGPHSADDRGGGMKNMPAPMILRIDVVDTGIGISATQLERLFTPFTQVDTSPTRRYGGTGLGLSIARKLATLLDGDITVASKPGIGSTFSLLVHVYLPTKESLDLAKANTETAESERGFSTFDSGVHLVATPPETQSERESEAAAPKAPPPLQGLRVLLVEDMVVNQLVISTQLKDAGAKTEIACNGEVALQRISADADNGFFFDVVLMDMQMPVMDGYEATRTLREQGYKRPIIAITAHALTGDREKTIEAGCDDYIAKPVDRKVLVDTIKKHLK